MKSALKAGDKDRLGVIRLMVAALKDAQMRGEDDTMSLADEQAVLRKMVKSRRDSVEQALAANRADFAAREDAEIVVIQSYLPATMGPDELRAAVASVAAEIDWGGPRDTGKFMKRWMSQYAGRAEGRDVQAALREFEQG